MAHPDNRSDCTPPRALHQLMECARIRAELSVEDLWWRYVALGGTDEAFDLDAHLQGILSLHPSQQNVLAHALNEALGELHRTHLVPLSPLGDGVDDELRGHLDGLLGPPWRRGPEAGGPRGAA